MRRALSLITLLAACSSGNKDVVSSTQLNLRLLNSDPKLQIDLIHAELWVNGSKGWTQRSYVDFGDPETLVFPVDIPIVPTQKVDKLATLEIILTAQYAGAQVAQQRVLTHFLPDDQAYLPVHLATCSGHPGSFVCSPADCHGDSCMQCNGSAGMCVAEIEQDPISAAQYDMSVSSMDASVSDAGHDAGHDAGDASSIVIRSMDANL